MASSSSTSFGSKHQPNDTSIAGDDRGSIPGPTVADGDSTEENSAEHIKACLKDADELKQEGTEHFRAERWAQALAMYRSALGRLPKRVREPQAQDHPLPPDLDADEGVKEEVESEAEKAPEPTPVPPLEGQELECAKARSVLNANIGACLVKLEDLKEAVKSCTEALADDPNYIKALQRRASCNEKLGTWSSLSSAQEDYKTLLKLLPAESPQVGPTRRALAAIGPRAEAAQKQEMGEVLNKLKGLGNSILGNFGLSTDNFKFEPNGGGGYSVNFQR